MMDELGQEPVLEEIPPGIEDFPEIVGDAINTFNSTELDMVVINGHYLSKVG